MTRALAYLSVAAVALVALIFLLVKMGAPGWFTLTFCLVLVGVTVAFIWPALIAAAIGFVLWKWVAWRSRRRGGFVP